MVQHRTRAGPKLFVVTECEKPDSEEVGTKAKPGTLKFSCGSKPQEAAARPKHFRGRLSRGKSEMQGAGVAGTCCDICPSSGLQALSILGKRKESVRGANGSVHAKSTSRFRGVTRHCRTGRWEAHIWDAGKQVYLGGFDLEEQAALAYDLAAMKLKGGQATTNFSTKSTEFAGMLTVLENVTKNELVAALRQLCKGEGGKQSSIYKGVTRHQKGRWEARIGQTGSKKYKYLGLFNSEVEAAMVYDRAAVRVRGIEAVTNFGLEEYKSLLSETQLEEAVERGLLAQPPDGTSVVESASCSSLPMASPSGSPPIAAPRNLATPTQVASSSSPTTATQMQSTSSVPNCTPDAYLNAPVSCMSLPSPHTRYFIPIPDLTQDGWGASHTLDNFNCSNSMQGPYLSECQQQFAPDANDGAWKPNGTCSILQGGLDDPKHVFGSMELQPEDTWVRVMQDVEQQAAHLLGNEDISVGCSGVATQADFSQAGVMGTCIIGNNCPVTAPGGIDMLQHCGELPMPDPTFWQTQCISPMQCSMHVLATEVGTPSATHAHLQHPHVQVDDMVLKSEGLPVESAFDSFGLPFCLPYSADSAPACSEIQRQLSRLPSRCSLASLLSWPSGLGQWCSFSMDKDSWLSLVDVEGGTHAF